MGTTRLDKSATPSVSRLAAGMLRIVGDTIMRRGQWMIDATATLAARHRRRRQLRRDLHRLNDHMLKDIGISRQDLVQEANKSIWRE